MKSEKGEVKRGAELPPDQITPSLVPHPDAFEAAVEGTGTNGAFVALPQYVERLYPSVRGGAWLECAQGGGNWPSRFCWTARWAAR